MLIHPWDAATSPQEWQAWLAGTDRFGTLAVNNHDPDRAPLVVPTHITLAGGQLVAHLARPNPVWPHLEAAAQVRVTFGGDQAYVPGYWRTRPDVPADHGVPTSYYTSVQFVCRPQIVDDPAGKAAILTAQLADLQPEGRHAPVEVDAGPYARMLPGIRGIQLTVLRVEAKFKYDDDKPTDHRDRVADQLDQRHLHTDAGAAAQQRRRLDTIGDWRQRR